MSEAMSETETGSSKPLGSYGPSLQPFLIRGEDLILSRRWEQKSDALYGTFASIKGRAVLDKDSVCIIGLQSDVETKTFELLIVPNDDPSKSWEKTTKECTDAIRFVDPEPDANAEDVYDRIFRLHMERLARLDKNPPTASLTCSLRRELGTNTQWRIHCFLPKRVFAQLDTELLGFRKITVSLEVIWDFGLVENQWLPWDSPAKWGLPLMRDQSDPKFVVPVPMYGHISSVTWNLQIG